MHPAARWTIITLCRKSDRDRNPKFFSAVNRLGAVDSVMGDMDDGPEQRAIPEAEVERNLLSLLPVHHFDLVVTHSPFGEYTRHRRHEEASRAVQSLWRSGRIRASMLWFFAFEDGGGRYPPRAVESAHLLVHLDEDVYREKLRLITDVYGFARDSFEARAASDREAFWCFERANDLDRWLERRDSGE